MKTGLAPEDLEAGRLLARLTCGEMAQLAQVDVSAVFDLSRGRVWGPTAIALRRELERRGVRFISPGRIEHVDGRLAPTRPAVGKMRGGRLRRARNAMGMTRLDVASEARLSMGTIAKLEGSSELRLTASVYAAVGALQLAGYRFAPNHGDRRLGPRRRPLRAWEKDVPIEMLGVGIHVRGMDDEFEEDAA